MRAFLRITVAVQVGTARDPAAIGLSESVRRHFIDRLTPADLIAVEQIARRLEEPQASEDRPGDVTISR